MFHLSTVATVAQQIALQLQGSKQYHVFAYLLRFLWVRNAGGTQLGWAVLGLGLGVSLGSVGEWT